MNPSLPPSTRSNNDFIASLTSGLRSSVDILIAPARAFDAMCAGRSRLVPVVLILALDVLAALMTAPAETHVEIAAPHVTGAAAPIVGSALVWALFTNNALYQVIWWPFMAMVLTLLAPRPQNEGRDDGQARSPILAFGAIFTLCVYATIPLALGNLIEGLVIRAHDPASFTTGASLQTAFPLSLASLPGSNEREQLFLGTVDIFSVWTLLLIGYGYIAITKARLTTAFAAVFGMALIGLVIVAATVAAT